MYVTLLRGGLTNPVKCSSVKAESYATLRDDTISERVAISKKSLATSKAFDMEITCLYTSSFILFTPQCILLRHQSFTTSFAVFLSSSSSSSLHQPENVHCWTLAFPKVRLTDRSCNHPHSSHSRNFNQLFFNT